MQLLCNRGIKTCLVLFLSLLLLLLLSALPVGAAENEIFVTAYIDTGRMANGEYAYYGAVACPSWLQLGTSIFINKLGYFICADRYASFLSDRFDISCPRCSLDLAYSYTGIYKWQIVE